MNPNQELLKPSGVGYKNGIKMLCINQVDFVVKLQPN